ncbi:DUF3859 domain-containing protein [Methylovirgula sp. 4M-Z18]|uniref:DUF3859 domain-containing protein n=1 Tax=Methylovirgula sp. 4M-Z18 TaxID=2293567 RepID=UPI000E2F03DE|nr:DUF3859 domain-containing protein [Methylovirgula sp. 4M-Z18]RFB78827.1 DUF3859 domain-containing protein [Methylovirgula sp. 4M-Z18]
MKYILPVLLGLCLASGAARAEDWPQISTLTIARGIYKISRAPGIVETHSEHGFTEPVADFHLTESTTNVPACLGMTFGFQYAVIGKPIGTSLPLHSVTIPPQDMHDPQVAKPIHTVTSDSTGLIGGQGFSAYTFDYAWELVPGIWTFQLWYGEQEILEEKFNVTLNCNNVSWSPELPTWLRSAALR